MWSGSPAPSSNLVVEAALPQEAHVPSWAPHVVLPIRSRPRSACPLLPRPPSSRWSRSGCFPQHSQEAPPDLVDHGERFTHLNQSPLPINSCQSGPQPIDAPRNASHILDILHLLAHMHSNPAIVNLLPTNLLLHLLQSPSRRRSLLQSGSCFEASKEPSMLHPPSRSLPEERIGCEMPSEKCASSYI